MKKFITITLTICLLLSAFAFIGCNSGGIKRDGTVIIAASSAPHAEILEEAKPLLLSRHNLKIEIKIFDDYTLFNPATADKSVYANYFQHLPFLNNYNENAKESKKLVSAGAIHFEPLGLYKGGKLTAPATLEAALSASSLTAAIPNDTTNGARALQLLADNELIEYTETARQKGLAATKYDFILKGITITELAAEQIPHSLNDVDIAVINGNYALSADISLDLQLAHENAESTAAVTYGNIIAVRPDCKDSDIVKALLDVLKSDEIKAFIQNKYGNAVISLD